MATGSVRPVRNLKSGRYRIRHESSEDVVVKLDLSKDPGENVREILRNVITQHGVASSKKTAYLNSFVKLIKSVGYDGSLGLPMSEIMPCLEVGLLNETKQIRTACLRVIRYLLPYEETLEVFLLLRFDYLVARCLDVSLDNEIERIHAIKLIRQIIKTAPMKFPKSLVFALVAIGNDGASERDRMVRVSLETICELAFRNVDLVSQCGGLQTLIWNILDCHQYPRLNEALTATIIYLLNHPKTRIYIKPQVDIERLLAPFTDSHFRYNWEDGRNEGSSIFIASKMAVITVMRSWPGLIRLCHPEGSGMQSLIGILYLPYVEIRKYVLEVISDLFRLPLPTWTDDFVTAFSSIDPSEMKDVWKLTEGFVAEEGRAILPHISHTRPNLIENHLALLLSAWLHAGLCEALVEVVITSEGALFNRAILLLGELLYMANNVLPPDCMHYSDCLPSLIAIASSTDLPREKRYQAYQAVMCLTRFHKMMKRGRVPCTLFLDQLLQHAGKMSEVTSKHWHLRREKLSEYYFKKVSTEEATNQAIKDSLVNTTITVAEWEWPAIAALLKSPDEKLKKLDDQNHQKFVKRLVSFYKPENELFSKMDIGDPNKRQMCIVASYLIDFLIASASDEAVKLITEWLTDIAENLKEVTKLNVPVDENAMFGTKKLHEKMSRYYFLFIGRFSATKRGCIYLEKCGIIQSFLELMCQSINLLYVKLVISSLSFTADGSTRPILSKALTGTPDVCRLYATKMLRVLMRAGTPGFSSWGVELLVTQLYDTQPSVAMSALNILDEASDNEESLKNLIKLRPSLLHLGEKGVMLLSRFVSTVQGFRALNDANFISSQLEKWHQSFNAQYVDIVEEMLSEALMTYEKTFSGSCPRRSILKGPKKDVFLPAHLYGQLTMHDEGLELLQKQECIFEYFSCIHNQILHNDADIRTLKTALWAVGHIGLSADGVAWLESENIIPELIRLAEECGVFSVRGTTFFVLGLIACTRKGADILSELGWECRCHTRKDIFPVLDQDGWMHGPMEEALRLSDFRSAAVHGERGRLSSYESMGLSQIQEETQLRTSSGATTATASSSNSSRSSAHSSLLRHSTPHNYHNIPPYTSPPSLVVPSAASRAKNLPNESEDFRRFQSLPTRSKSEKALPRKSAAAEYRPRAMSTDKKIPAPASVSGRKSGSEPLDVDSISCEFVRSDSVNGAESDHRVSRDSIQLIASPVVRLRTSSDGDSALSDHCDSNASQHSEQKEKTEDNNNHHLRHPSQDDQDAPTMSETTTTATSAVTAATQSLEKLSEVEVAGSHSVTSPNLLSPTRTSSEKSCLETPAESEVVSFRIGSSQVGGGGSSSAGFSKQSSSSSEGSNRSKSRGSSFNATDSTSGVGSCESNPRPVATSTAGGTTITSSLTPIPSSSSISTLAPSSNLLTGAEQAKEPVHPSALSRSVFRLSRIPSAKRRSASPAVAGMSNGGQSYTSYRDTVGYAALRAIKRQRTYSSEGDSEGGTHLEAPPSIIRTVSQDSELSVDSNMWLSIRRNVSSASLQDPDAPASPIGNLNRAAFKPLSPCNRFVGISLPVDIKMIFEVVEGEDKRSSSVMASQLRPGGPGFPADLPLSAMVPPLKKETAFAHTKFACLLCCDYRQKILPTTQKKEGESREATADDEGKGEHEGAVHNKLSRSRGGSVNDQSSSATPGSVTSNSSSQETGDKKMSEDSVEGRELINLEVMRLIINLGSSLGLRSYEAGLLSLKQRFPKCFRDVCFYSEVCYLLSTYSYRLLARRFIQELFDELDISELLEGPCRMLGVDWQPNSQMTPIRQDSLDEFQDFSFS
ncbi:RPTOR independent companion of MTOR, complex 2 [Aplysia californica]|uniref:RPTOR independent companion of MTOR, complex 2 n=1 Tax=Aplysia californica TaxID=6500 RepID=I6YLH5_APLCA|nr:RPTOR independent companion of MTOR, complex 2 [Aplysia californica]AFN55128.1 rictor [Aplysia californica]